MKRIKLQLNRLNIKPTAMLAGLLVVLILSTFVWVTPVKAQTPINNFTNAITSSVNQIGNWFNNLSQNIQELFASKPTTVYVPYPVFQYQPATGTSGKIVVNGGVVGKKTIIAKPTTVNTPAPAVNITQPSTFVTNNFFSASSTGINSYGDNVLGGTLSFASGTIIDFSNTHVFNWPHTYGGGGSVTNVTNITNNYTSAETDPWFMLASSSLSYLKVEADPLWSLASTTLTVANFATSSVSQWINDAGYLTAVTLSETDPYWVAVSTTVPYLASQNTFTATNTIANLIVNGRVGVGITPTTALDVNGALTVRSYIDYYGRGYIGNASSLFTGVQSYLGIRSVGNLYFGTNNDVSAPKMTLDSSGNLGIGSSTPTAKLVVQGSSTAPLLHITTSSTASALYIADSGYVGIGTASPGAKLEINGGNIYLKGDTGSGYGQSFYVYDQNNTGKLRIYQQDSSGVSISRIISDGGISFSAAGGYYTATASTYFNIGSGANNAAYFNAGGLFTFRDVDDSNAIRVTIDSATGGANFGLNGGNVGIGTTTPNANLNIFGTTSTLLRVATSTNQNIFVINANGDASLSGNLTVSNLNGPLQAINGLISATSSIDSSYLSSNVMLAGENISLLNNDANYLTAGTTSDALTEGTINKFYTQARVWADIIASSTFQTFANYWTKTGNDLSYSSGHVGVGTSTPNATFGVTRNIDSFNYVGNSYSTINDYTTEARTTWGTAFIVGVHTTEYFLVGKDATFENIYFDLAAGGTGSIAWTWEYSTGNNINGTSTWGTLAVTDGTVGLTLDGNVSFTPPGDWAPGTTNDYSYTGYLIRLRPTSANPGTHATANLVVPSMDSSPTEIYANQYDTAPTLVVDPRGGVAIGYADASTYRLRVNGTGYFSTGIVSGVASFSGAITNALTAGYAHTGGLLLSGTSATAAIPVQNSPVTRFTSQGWNGTTTKANAMDIYLNPDSTPTTGARLAFKNTTVNGYADDTELMNLSYDGDLNVLGSAQVRDNAFDSVQHYIGSVYTDDTAIVSAIGVYTADVLNVYSDYFYIGKKNNFSSIYFDFQTIMSAGTTRTWEYSADGETWKTLAVTDGTTNWSTDGTVTFTPPSDWAKGTVNTASSLYWVRVGTAGTGVFSTEPTLRLVLTEPIPDILSNGEFDTTSGWTTNGDWGFSTLDYTFTQNTGAGTLTQASSSFALSVKPNTWYRFRYVVGVAAPATTLTWIGDEFADHNVYFTGSASEEDVFFKTNSNPGDFVIHTTASATSGFQLDAVSLVEMTGGDITATGLLTGGGTSGLKIDGNGNVGIGATTLSARLQVMGTTGSNNLLTLASSSGVSLLTVDSNGYFSMGTTSTSSLMSIQAPAGVSALNVASSSGLSMFTIAGNGNVGINTLGVGNPNNTVDIWGAGSGSRGALRFSSPTGLSYWDIGREGTQGDFEISSAGVEKLRITTAGNVGIGTSTPINPNGSAKALVLYDNVGSYPTINVKAGLATGGAFFQQDNDVSHYLAFGTYGSANAGTALFGVPRANNSFIFASQLSGVTGLTIGTYGHANLTLGTNNTANLTIQDGGNVGIGTTTPFSTLTVQATSGVSALNVVSSSGSSMFTVLANGNVGVGIGSPNAGLDVNGITQAISYNIVNGANTLSVASNYSRLYGLGGVKLSVWSGSAYVDALTVVSTTGYVGIGTANPVSILTSYGVNDNLTLQSGSDSTGVRHSLVFQGGAVNIEARIQSGNYGSYNGGLDFQVSPYGGASASSTTVSAMFIKAGGNVGIGTTNPLTKLHVQGTTATDLITSDLGFDFRPVVNPLPANIGIALVDTATGNLGIGTYYYYVSFYTALGETGLGNSTPGSVTTDATHKQITVTLPVSSDYRVIGRKIYRSSSAGDSLNALLVAQIANNTDVTYTDNIADASRTGSTMFWRENTTSKFITMNGSGVMMTGLGREPNTILGAGAGATIFAGTATAGAGVIIGFNAGRSLTTGSKNNAVGYSALQNVTSGGSNQAMGWGAMVSLTTGSGNVGIGHDSGYYNISGSSNTFIGQLAGFGSSTYSNSYNTFLGNYSGYSITTGGSNIFLGSNSGYRQTSASNLLIVDNQTRADVASEASSSIIYGVMAASPMNQTLTFNAKVGIGTSTPLSTLTVQGVSGVSALNVVSSTGASMFTVASNGYVGIGTTTPTNQLHVYVAGAIAREKIESTSNSSGLILTTGGASGGIIYALDAVNALSLQANNGTKMLIDQNGNVGIGTTTPNANLNIFGTTNTLLRVATSTNQGIFVIGADGNATFGGSITATSLMGGATNLTVDANGTIIRDTSDINLKENVTPLAGAMDKVLALQGVSFNWKDKSRFGTQEEIGFVAQQVQGVVPQLVSSGGSYLSLKYPNVTALLVEAFKEQYRLVSTDTLAMFGTTTATTTSYWMTTSTLAEMTSTEVASAIASSTAIDIIVSRLTQGFSIIREFFAEKVVAAIGIFDQLKTRYFETDVAKINKGMEIIDAVTGEIYCIRIVNGDWSKVKESCNVAGAYEAVAPAITTPENINTDIDVEVPAPSVPKIETPAVIPPAAEIVVPVTPPENETVITEVPASEPATPVEAVVSVTPPTE